MGSLSHYINCRAIGYQDLPQFPDSPTDSSVRCVAVPEEQEKPVKLKTERTVTSKKKTFYSDSEENSDESSSESDDSDDSDSSSDSSYEKIGATEVKYHCKNILKYLITLYYNIHIYR